MARNCPSYKTMYSEAQSEVRELRRRLRSTESRLEHQDRFIDSLPDDEGSEEDEVIRVKATVGELQQPDPFLNLEGRAILIVYL
jgi:septation ring formation regulator EzrA